MKKNILLLIVVFANWQMAFCQETKTEEEKIEKLSPKEFSIPISPLFDLFGAAPNQVASTNNIKNFKVDWSYRNWKVSPNIAIQAQPIWEIFYNRKKLEKYQNAGYVKRMLASLDLSIGTVQTETWDRKIGAAIKVKLYNAADPLLLKGVYDDIELQFSEELALLKKNEKMLLHQLDSLIKPKDIGVARNELIENDIKLTSIYSRRTTAIQERAQNFIANNWNAAFVDLAYGKVNAYIADSAGKIQNLILNRNTANAAWLNFGFGLGKRSMISGLIRTTGYKEELFYTINEVATNKKFAQTAYAQNNIYSLGINVKYGGPVYDFFIEFIREGKNIKTVNEAFAKIAPLIPAGNTLVANSLKWEGLNPYTINIGGDWRISRNVALNFGIRGIYDNDFKKVSFTPIANVSCMMR
jgi:hypothetical protein